MLNMNIPQRLIVLNSCYSLSSLHHYKDSAYFSCICYKIPVFLVNDIFSSQFHCVICTKCWGLGNFNLTRALNYFMRIQY